MRVFGDRIVQGKTTACITCHGPDLMGIGDVPPIAGRSPSYIVRQLWDIQQGTRRGVSSQLMKMIVANLNEDDLVNVAAYVASRPPTCGRSARTVGAARALAAGIGIYRHKSRWNRLGKSQSADACRRAWRRPHASLRAQP